MKPHRGNPGIRRLRAGGSLIIVLAVLAIVAIFALVLLRALLREIDVEVARQEVSTLESYQRTLQATIVREGFIPDAGGWVATVAMNTGAQTTDVATNKRRQNRVLLIDPACTISLPYTQSNAGLSLKPADVRMMLISSLGQGLPVTNGQVLSATNFSALWNAAEGTANVAPNAAWAVSEDVKIQRMDLSPLFLKAYLRTLSMQPSPPLGLYAIGTNTSLSAAALDPNPPPRYYMMGTVLRLYNPNGTLDSTQVLNRRSSFKYEDGMWKGDPSGAIMPGGVDLAAVARAFLEAAPNLRAQYGADQQRLVLLGFMDYLRNYNTWADGGFTDNALKQYMLDVVQPGMRQRVQGLFLKEAPVDFYPANGTTCP